MHPPIEKKTSGTIVRPLHVVCFEPDATSVALVQAALKTAHRLTLIDSPSELVDYLRNAGTTVDILLLALPASRSAALALLQAIDALPHRPLVLGLAAQLDDGTLDSFVRRSLDDVVLKPFDAPTLRVRLRLLGTRTQLGSDFGPTARVLRSSLAHKSSGEVIVRSARGVARIVVTQGNVRWVHCPWKPMDLGDVLASVGARVSRDELEAMAEEARQTGASFFSVIARWGIAAPAALERALERALDELVESILADATSFAMFVPSKIRSTVDGPMIDGEQIVRGKLESLPPPRHSEPPSAPIDVERAEQFAEQVGRACRASCMALVEIATRKARWLTSDAPCNEMLWAMLPLVAVDPVSDERSEVIIVRGDDAYVLWREAGVGVAVFGRFSLAMTSVGFIVSAGRRASSYPRVG